MRKLLILFLGLASVMAMGASEFAGKRVVLMGDSNTWIGGEQNQDSVGWNYWFAEYAQPLSLVNLSRSGATWSHTGSTRQDLVENITWNSDNNVIYNQVRRLEQALDNGMEAPDYVIIAAGVNDVWSGKRPNAFGDPSSAQSVAGAVKINCELIKERLPNVQIILVTPALNQVTADDDMHRVGDVIENACTGTRTVRLDRLPEAPATRDGVHTIAPGARVVARAIAG